MRARSAGQQGKYDIYVIFTYEIYVVDQRRFVSAPTRYPLLIPTPTCSTALPFRGARSEGSRSLSRCARYRQGTNRPECRASTAAPQTTPKVPKGEQPALLSTLGETHGAQYSMACGLCSQRVHAARSYCICHLILPTPLFISVEQAPERCTPSDLRH